MFGFLTSSSNLVTNETSIKATLIKKKATYFHSITHISSIYQFPPVTDNDAAVNFRLWRLVIGTYLKNNDISPLYPSIIWNAEAMIMAPCNSFIICLKFCQVEMSQDQHGSC